MSSNDEQSNELSSNDDEDLSKEDDRDELSNAANSSESSDDDDEESDVFYVAEQEWAKLSKGQRDLLVAMESQDTAGVQHALRNGANVNGDCHYDMTPLANACDRGYDGIVRILLDAGANAWWKNEWGYSAIFIAIAGGHLSIVEMLLNHDKDLLEIKDRDGETPLQFAISQLQFGIVYRLLDQGANVHGTTRSGKNTLMYACQNGNLDILRLLLAAGVDAEARDVFQKTVLHYAASSRNVEAVRELILQHNANMFAVDNTGNTSFDRACNCEQTPEAAELLLEIYGNKMTQENGRLALHELLKLAEYSFAETEAFHPPLNSLRIRAPLGTLTVKYWRTLLQSFDMELIRNRDGNGKLPIHIACRTNAPVEILSVLVNLDLATLQMADDHGNLPMHECCFGAVDHSSVRYLVEQGGVGTLAARNRLGLLPLHVLCGSTDPSWRTVQFLIESFSESVSARNNAGEYPLMIAAAETSSASLSVIYELVRANPDWTNPR